MGRAHIKMEAHMNIKMRFPGGAAAALTLSYDDGSEADIRLIEIMSKHGLKGTFNINSRMFDSDPNHYEAIRKAYIESGNEVACHGVTHPFLDRLSTPEMIHEVLDDRERLEKEFDTIIQGMAYPFGTYNKDVLDVLKQCGIYYSRTVISTGRFDFPQNWLEWHPTCHHNDQRLFELTEQIVNHKEDTEPLLFYVWGHSYEFDRNDNWDRMEKFAEMIGNRDNIWYATNIDIYNYVRGYSRLEKSARGNIIHNPNAFDVWVRVNGSVMKIEAGETVRV